MRGIALGLFCFAASPALALDVAYHAAVEFKPLSILLNPIEGGRGASLGLELGSIANTFVTMFAERATTRTEISRVSHNLGSNSFGAGLRTYSYYRTDSLYFGAEVRRTEVEFAAIGESEPWLMHQSHSLRVETGFRWLWESNLMIRVGIDVARQLGTTAERDAYVTEKLALQPDTAEPEAFDNIASRRLWQIGGDLGLGIVF